jgi:N-acetylglucosaminyl-diphospho-decaprenol L-rhamnosyltransferase
MRSTAPWARVVIVNYNSGELLQRCVDALARQTLADFEAVIVDNASSDGSSERLRLPDDRFCLDRAGANLGFAAASNRGAAMCTAAWLALLNPDAEPDPAWLNELQRATERHPYARMFGSTQIDAAHPDRVDGFGDVYSVFGTAWRGASGVSVAMLPNDDREVFAPCAAGALYARQVFEAGGGFDEAFFCYLEDVDLGFRLRLQGERCVQVRKALLAHVGSASAGRNSDFFIWHSQRNRIWVMVKNLPAPLLWPSLLLQLAVAPLVVLRRGPGKWGIACAGLLAGLRALPRIWRSRSVVQRARVVSSGEIARLLVFDPRQALRHAPHFLDRSAQATSDSR